MVKKITSNTILFLCIVGFVTLFKGLFGEANSLVGVTLIISILILMRENLIKNPVKNFLAIIFLNIISGVFSHVSSQNMWLGLLLNAIVVGGIGYLLSYKLNKMLIIPFGLQYLFMLYTPVVGIDYRKRLIALVVGAIVIMISQFIIHRKNKNIEIDESQLISFDYDKDDYEEVNIFNRKFSLHPIRARYAVRIGIIVSLSAFLVSYFKLEQGRWIVYTVFSVTELYSEHCRVRSKQRLEGTLIGAFIVLVLFMFIKDEAIRGLIILLGGYLDTYTTNYRDKIICVTMSVVASTALTSSTLMASFERILYIFIGIALALFINKYVLETKMNQQLILNENV